MPGKGIGQQGDWSASIKSVLAGDFTYWAEPVPKALHRRRPAADGPRHPVATVSDQATRSQIESGARVLTKLKPDYVTIQRRFKHTRPPERLIAH